MGDDQTVQWMGQIYTREFVCASFARGWNPFLNAPARPDDPRVLGFSILG